MTETEKKIAIADETLAILEKGFYNNMLGNRHDIVDHIKSTNKNTILYRPNDFEKLQLEATQILNERCFNTSFEFANESTVDAVIRMIDNDKLACLNFASAKNPGGGFKKGTIAQEEDLARSSALYPSIAKMSEMYDFNKSIQSNLYSNYMVFSPNVVFIRDGKESLLESPVFASIITAAAVNVGQLKVHEPEKANQVWSVMNDRITMMLNVALTNNVEVLILGAWGCGVFQNDPTMIAKLFSDHFQTKYARAFKHVLFSILDRNNILLNTFSNALSK